VVRQRSRNPLGMDLKDMKINQDVTKVLVIDKEIAGARYLILT